MNLPLLVFFGLYVFLFVLAFGAAQRAQLYRDAQAGLVFVELSQRQLSSKILRCERLMATTFALGFFTAMVIAGTMEYASLSR